MSIQSPNMLLPVPEVGTTSGPQYSQDINDSLSIIDQHDHSTGSGVPITPSGLDISSDLTMQDNNLTNIRTTRFQAQPSTLAGASDVNCLYVSGVDLYYNDGSNIIRITTGGSVNAGAGSIGGLPSGTASVSYSGGSYIFESATNVGGDLDARNVLLRNNSASSYALTLSPPNAMGADYTLVMPSLPASQKIMTLDASGNITAPYVTDNSTIEINSNTIRVKPLGITSSQIANNTITGTQISNTLSLGGTLTTANQIAVTSGGVAVTLGNIYTSSGNIYTSSGIIEASGTITSTSSSITANTNLTATTGTVGAGTYVYAKGSSTYRAVTTSGASPSAGAMLTVIRGKVSGATGTKTAGEAFTCSRSGTGTYTLTWSVTQASAPVVTVTLTDTVGIALVTATSTTTASISTFNTSGSATDHDFGFIAIGSVS